MSEMKKKKIMDIILLLPSLCIITLLIGQACGSFHQEGAVYDLGISSTGPDSIIVKPNAQTASMTYARQIVDSYVSCTGIQKASDAVNTVFSERKGSLSEFGYAIEVSSPMLMASVAIAGEVCNQLIDNELKLLPEQRRIFAAIDFSASPNSISNDAYADVVRRIARSCWTRHESSDELSLIIDGVSGAFTSSDQTKDAMLMLCSGMLGSLSGTEM